MEILRKYSVFFILNFYYFMLWKYFVMIIEIAVSFHKWSITRQFLCDIPFPCGHWEATKVLWSSFFGDCDRATSHLLPSWAVSLWPEDQGLLPPCSLTYLMWLLPALRASDMWTSKEVKEKQGKEPKRLVSLILWLGFYLSLSDEQMGEK